MPGSPGQVQVQWLGLKCVQLQSVTNLTSASWLAHPATDGRSATNFSTSGTEGYFRLMDKSP